MQKGNLMEHIKSWSIKDLADSYNIDLSDDDIEVALNELIKYLIKDIKECDSYDDKNN